MTKGELQLAICRAHNLFDQWNDCTGYFVKGSGYYFECLACIDDAVHCGAQAATGDKRTLPGEADIALDTQVTNPAGEKP